jgi:hypothetical protein
LFILRIGKVGAGEDLGIASELPTIHPFASLYRPEEAREQQSGFVVLRKYSVSADLDSQCPVERQSANYPITAASLRKLSRNMFREGLPLRCHGVLINGFRS